MNDESAGAASEPEDRALVEVESVSPPAMWGTTDPSEVIDRALEIATRLGEVVERAGLYSTIQGNRFVNAEGWALLGQALGVYPIVVRLERLPEEPEAYEAEVELRTRDGALVGNGISEVSVLEARWANAERHALKSMAQTRATSRAYRLALGFVMKTAGFEATPMEEMPDEREARPAPPRPVSTETDQIVDLVRLGMDQRGFTNEDLLRVFDVAPSRASMRDRIELIMDGGGESIPRESAVVRLMEEIEAEIAQPFDVSDDDATPASFEQPE
jgi:hypothetical protein